MWPSIWGFFLLSMMFIRFVQTAIYVSTSFLFMVEYYSSIWIYHIYLVIWWWEFRSMIKKITKFGVRGLEIDSTCCSCSGPNSVLRTSTGKLTTAWNSNTRGSDALSKPPKKSALTGIYHLHLPTPKTYTHNLFACLCETGFLYVALVVLELSL